MRACRQKSFDFTPLDFLLDNILKRIHRNSYVYIFFYFHLAEKPKFSQRLRFSTQNLTVGTKVSINNCWYTAPFEYAETFWTKNGVKINSSDVNTVPSRKRRSDMDPDALLNLPKYRLGDFVIDKLSLADQGTYKCGIRGTDGVEYFSKEIYLGLKGK